METQQTKQLTFMFLQSLQCCPICGGPELVLCCMEDHKIIHIQNGLQDVPRTAVLMGWSCDACGTVYERVDTAFYKVQDA